MEKHQRKTVSPCVVTVTEKWIHGTDVFAARVPLEYTHSVPEQHIYCTAENNNSGMPSITPPPPALRTWSMRWLLGP